MDGPQAAAGPRFDGPVPTQDEAKAIGWKIFKYADTKDKVLMGIGITAALVSGVGMPAYSQLNGSIVSNLTSDPADLESAMGKIALNLIYVAIAMSTMMAVSGYCMTYATMRQTTRIKLLYFEALMRQEVGWHDAHPPGELTSRMDGDVKVIEGAMGDNFTQLVQNTGTIVFGFALAFYNGWELTLLMLSVTPIISGITIYVGRLLKKASEEARDGYATAGGIALEAIDNIKTVQVFGREQHEAGRFAKAVVPAVDAGIRKEVLTYLNAGVSNFFTFLTFGVGYWFGGYLVYWGRCTVSEVVTVFFSCLMASFSINRLSPCMSTFLEGAGAAVKIFGVIERVPLMDPMCRAEGEDIINDDRFSVASPVGDEGAPLLSSAPLNTMGTLQAGVAPYSSHQKGQHHSRTTNATSKGCLLPDRTFKDAIVFKNVAFSYPTRKEDKLFTNLNMSIKKGQTVAFSGASGCGKSSIIGLVQRFYDPDGGMISVDGINMKDLNLRGWRDCISIVSQEPKLFTGTVMENVKIARPDATDEEVIAACKKAHVHQVIDKLPQKYGTLVGTGGSQLSGGQKQRVAIARALIRNPQILILDEATSALDRKSEVEVQAALEDVMQQSRSDGTSGDNANPLTVIVIAHRLATIQNADVIHYVNHDDVQGSWIEESGTYEELMAMDGHFAAMTKKQQSSSAKDGEKEMDGAADADDDQPKKGQRVASNSNNDSARGGEDASALSTSNNDAQPTVASVPSSTADVGSLAAAAADADADADDALYADAMQTPLKQADEEGVKKVPSQHMRVLQLCKGNRWGIVVGVVGCVLAGAEFPAQAVVSAYVLKVLAEVAVDPDVIHSKMPTWCCCFFGIAGATIIAHLMMCCFAFVGERLTLKLRRVLFYSILRQDMTFFDTPGRDSSSLAAILSTDTQIVHGLWGPSIGSNLRLATTMGAGLVIAFFYSWRLSLVTLSTIPLFAIMFGFTTYLLKSFGAEDDNAIKAEALTNIRTVVSLNLQDQMIAKYRAHVLMLEHKQRYNAIIKAVQGGGIGIIMFCNMAMLAWYSGRVIATKQNTFVETSVAQQAIMQGLRGLGEAGIMASKFKDAGAAVRRVFYIIDREPTIVAAPKANVYGDSDDGSIALTPSASAVGDDADAPPTSIAPVRGGDAQLYDDLSSVSLAGLRFRYPARPEAPLLRGVDLEFTMPRTYGLMGETGCGKSTLVGLLTRFYDPAAGTVTVTLNNNKKGGGVEEVLPLKDMDLGEWRQRISLVLQEPSLFSGTIRENILYAKPTATQAEVEQAAKYAAIHDDIMLMPDGYDTDVGYKGQSLSGGQKQRVAIARALIRKPRILLMDEATSALDNNTEGRVEQGIRDACKVNKMIVIAVAHRLTTIRDSDSIAVMEAGRVKEKGSHDELIALGGHYKDRWQLFERTAQHTTMGAATAMRSE